MNRKNILILEPDRDVSELLARAIEIRRDCKCYLAGGEEEALDLMQDIPFALALIDLGIAMEGEFRLLEKMKRRSPNLVVVVNAFLHQKDYLERALAMGASSHLFKPIKLDSFRKRMEEVLPPPPASLP